MSQHLYQFDVAAVIGRFQGAQVGHGDVIVKALEVAHHVRVLVGSANVARDTRNPFTYEERRAVLERLIADRVPQEAHRVSFVPIDDTPYDKHAWMTAVTIAVRGATKALRPRIALVGNIRDETSEYLTWFPAWTFIPVKDTGYNATALRKAFFSGTVNFDSSGWSDGGFDWSTVPKATVDFMREFRDQPVYAYLMKQLANETAYKAKWGPGPFQTVDPVIIKGDHILMIERGGPEGTGSIGLPGGFLNAGERPMWAAAREAIEETGLFIDDRDLPAMREHLERCKEAERAGEKPPQTPEFMLTAVRTLLTYQKGAGERFADPNRSRRGHLITEAFLFQLPDGHGLPRVVGLDDARAAFWKPTSELSPADTFEDHAHIADYMISRYATF